MKINPLQGAIDPKFQKMNLPLFVADWFAVVGSALRGLISRAEDYEISLTGIDVQEEFRQGQLLNFIKIWRNIAITSFGTILLIFLAAGLLLIKTEQVLKSQSGELREPSPINQELNSLREEARQFNEKIDLIAKAKSQTNDWSPLLQKIITLAGSEIAIQRILLQSLER